MSGPGAAGAEPTDAELLRSHAAGDAEAFGALFLRHRDRLWAVAVRTLGDPEEAADALQDAMISAFRRASTFRGDSAVTTWLHRIVVNACLDRLRRKAARPVSGGLADEALDAMARDPRPAVPSTDADVALDVTAALRALPPDQRAALVLVDMLGYPVADAAEVLAVSVGTVKSRCARGRARLAPRLAHLRGQAGSGTAGSRAESPGQGGAGSPASASGQAGAGGRAGTGHAGAGGGPADHLTATVAPADSQPGAAERNQAAPGYVSPAERGGDSRP
ncbi:MAG: RNA polymerase sigma factor SigM [Actinobacteria bacterium]|nr:RNA polymerase sigma factor SigM [Actinomycetota bacterium]